MKMHCDVPTVVTLGICRSLPSLLGDRRPTNLGPNGVRRNLGRPEPDRHGFRYSSFGLRLLISTREATKHEARQYQGGTPRAINTISATASAASSTARARNRISRYTWMPRLRPTGQHAPKLAASTSGSSPTSCSGRTSS